MDTVRDIKESMCYVVGDFDAAMKESSETGLANKHYELPDGKSIKVGNERFRCAEALFRPEVLGKETEGSGVHQQCFDSIVKSHDASKVRSDFFSNIILSGGNTLFEGMSERMQTEMSKLAG